MALFYKRQQGAALLVALVMMLLVAVLGLSAIRSSQFSGQVATTAQADAMTFEAAETALRVTYNQLLSMQAETLFESLDRTAFNYCIKSDNTASIGKCTDSDRIDHRGLLKAGSKSMIAGYYLRDGFSASKTGSGEIHVDYRIHILGESQMPGLGLENYHLQEAAKFGLLPASDID